MQLSFDDLMPTPVIHDRYPNVENITAPFEWARLDYLMSLPSVDFRGDPAAMSNAYNRESKRRDYRFEELLEDIQEQGFLDPVFVYGIGQRLSEDNPDSEVLGNGHHRVVAAFDLGYTFVPVTRDANEQWRESGQTSR